MYHQPIKLPFSKLCKSVELCPWLTFTLLHQFEPMLLFEILFSFYFQCYIRIIFFLFDNANVLNKHFWKIEKTFFRLFWKQTWATGYIQVNHAWIKERQCLFQYMLQADCSPGWSVVNGKNEKNRVKMKKWKDENENEKLAKSKTQKGGLGKNEHSADWQPMKAIQAKMGPWKEFIPGGLKTRKGGSGKNGIEKWKNEKWYEKHWPQMGTSNVYPALVRLAMATCIKESSKVPSSVSFVYVMWYISLIHGFDTSLNDGLSEEDFLCVYVIARATTCPILQCFVCLCETSLPNYKPIMHFKHSYMHNHAFYVLIHLIILLYHTYMLHFLSQFLFNSISTSNSIQFELSIQWLRLCLCLCLCLC